MSVVTFTVKNLVGTITINRPEALNAINSEVLNELELIISKASVMDFDQLRCLILTGSGERAFVAGADIKEIHQLRQVEALKFAEKGQGIFRSLENLRVPVIAAVNGFALGGGLELALACDFIIASDRAKLGLPEVSLGLIPGFGGTIRLTRVVGKARAKEMILTGNSISAMEALACGLVNRLYPSDSLMSEVVILANTIVSRGPLALDAAKKTIDEAESLSVDQAQVVEAQHFSSLFRYLDVLEGTQAFIDKRKPEFHGR